MSTTEAMVMREREAPAVPGELLPSPVFRGQQMVAALQAYRELQQALDASMPDQVMELDGKPFRKKGYWRAISVAFNLTVEPITDPTTERSVIGQLEDGSENYVYTVSYRATAPNGRYAVGDGTCAASEKQRGRMRATEHNVRGHAHTRAFNRSVSNLCGFGEVSAEEVDRDEERGPAPDKPAPATREDGSVRVHSIETRTGTNKRGPWTMYVITFDDGRKASTFDQKLAHLAGDAKKLGTLMIPRMEKNGDFWNITGLSEAPVEGEIIGAGGLDERDDPIRPITEQEANKLRAVMRGAGWTEDDVLAFIATAMGLDSIAAISASGYETVLQQIKGNPKK